MKRFLQWFVTLLQILFGLVFIAAVGLFIFDKFDIDSLKDDSYLKYAAYACAGLYAVLSAVVMAVVIHQRSKIHSLVINDDNGFTARISAGKIKKLLKDAAAAVEGVKLTKFFIKAGSAGYVLKLKINVSYRNAKEASAEFEGVAARLCEEVYGLIFARTDIIVGKVKAKAETEEIKKEVKAAMELNAVKELESAPVSDYGLPEHNETPQIAEAPYYGPPTEDTVPQAAPAPVFTQAEPVAPAPQETATVYAPEPKAETGTAIKTDTAVKTVKKTAPKAAAPAAAKTTVKTAAATKTAAKTPAKRKTEKQAIDPNDPPPFKL